MEDATVIVPELKENVSLFGVFDGHNGSTCSNFIAQLLPEVLREHPFLEEAPSLALNESFLKTDARFLEYCVENGSGLLCL
mgnify:CR=1 FL=1